MNITKEQADKVIAALKDAQHTCQNSIEFGALVEALTIMRGLEDAEPVGWKLVPIEPTNEMLDAGYCVVEDTKGVIKATYRAMCAAAPIYMAKTKHGESCHFGSKSTAVAWAGSAGLVSELKK